MSAGKGPGTRKGANFSAYWANYPDIFRKPKPKRMAFIPSIFTEPKGDIVTLMRLRESAKKATKKK